MLERWGPSRARQEKEGRHGPGRAPGGRAPPWPAQRAAANTAEQQAKGAVGHAPRQAQGSDHTSRTEPCLSASPIQPGRYVRIHLNTADGGHRGADANTDYVGPQEGEVLTAAALAVAV